MWSPQILNPQQLMITKNIIINADDCGMSTNVDACIGEAILLGKITSTTIMANMYDFEGAVRLYREYHNEVSFGWHINLDEGTPLTESQLLLDIGFFTLVDGKLLLNGRSFGKKYLNKHVRNEIRRELRAQYEKIRDHGIDITHVDSHHYIHTQPSMILVIPSLLNELGIKKCRRVANYGVSGLRAMAKDFCATYYKFHGLTMPDTFCSFREYLSNCNMKQGNTIELMIHPGHPKEEYALEYKSMMDIDYGEVWPQAKMISYKEL